MLHALYQLSTYKYTNAAASSSCSQCPAALTHTAINQISMARHQYAYQANGRHRGIHTTMLAKLRESGLRALIQRVPIYRWHCVCVPTTVVWIQCRMCCCAKLIIFHCLKLGYMSQCMILVVMPEQHRHKTCIELRQNKHKIIFI